MVKKNKSKIKGFTLVEVLASMAIFLVLSVSLVVLFTNSINTQARILQNQQLLNESSHAMEYMYKAIRMAYRDDGYLGNVAGSCTGTANLNYNVSNGTIYFLGYDNPSATYKCIKFYLDTSDNKIKVKKSTDAGMTYGSADAATAMELTSSQVKISSGGLSFSVSGDSTGNQPKVTIMMDMLSTSKRVSPIPEIIIQTTASQRNLNLGP
jgi:prepilin-type N-terminal cleavage/methylation domain-containing protein